MIQEDNGMEACIKKLELKDIKEFENGPIVVYNKNSNLKLLFEDVAEKFPENTAVTYESRSLTYKALNSKSNGLAEKIINVGIKTDDIVCIIADRSVEMIVGIIAILKAGAAYLPINSKDPKERIEYIISDSKAKACIIASERYEALETKVPQFNLADLDENKEIILNKKIDITPENLAYIIYTSGTAGNPKGVMIRHRNVLNLLVGLNEVIYSKIDTFVNIACVAPYYFDASVQQIFPALTKGHNLVIVPESIRMNPDQMARLYIENNIYISDGTPTFISLLGNSYSFRNNKIPVRYFIIGGEKMQYTIAERFLKCVSDNTELINVYGPTECCVDSTYFTMNKSNIERINEVPIGRPMANQKVLILDKDMNKVVPDTYGDIYVSGDNVGKGYLNRETLTQEKYIQFGNDKNEIIYRTGDIGKWDMDGNIIYSCRIDNLVKIRGNRIELEEIENLILRFNKKAIVTESPKINHCKRCLMSTACPEIIINENGLCNVCNTYFNNKDKINRYFKTIIDFDRLMIKAKKNKKSEYDCLLLYSGGKDSSYVLYKLIEKGYKVLAFTFDNGYISERAFKNIKKVTKALKVDSIICKSEKMDEIFRESLITDSTVCTGCFKALSAISTKIAFEKGINVVISGLSRGQILDTKLQKFYDTGEYDVNEIDQKLLDFRKIYHSTKDIVEDFLNVDLDDKDAFDNTYFIDYYRYEDVLVKDILRYLISKDELWIVPEDTGFCSTNCLINDVGIYVHSKEKGFHNYMIPLSWSCRLGQITREEGEEELKLVFNNEKVKQIINKIGYIEKEEREKSQIDETIVIDNTDEKGDMYLVAFYTSQNDIDKLLLRKYLSRYLPSYAIPSYYIQIPEVPKTSNGKIDRFKLKGIKPEAIRNDKYKAPKTETEKDLVRLWCELLSINLVGVTDNFFELGGHSLKAIMMVSEIQERYGVDIKIGEIFKFTKIQELASYIDSQEKKKKKSIIKAQPKKHYEVSSAQKRMYILNMMNPNSLVYNNIIHTVKGQINIDHLNIALKNIIDRHEALRTKFSIINKQIMQTVLDTMDFNLFKTECEKDNLLKNVNSFITVFELDKPPLFQVGVFKYSSNEYIFVLNIHHIISDAVTVKFLFDEIANHYNGEPLKNLEFQYKDYSEWEKCYLESFKYKEQKDYWLNKFKDFRYKISLLSLKNELNQVKNTGKSFYFNLDKEDVLNVKKYLKYHDFTLFMILLSAYGIWFSRIVKNNDIVVGTPVVGRNVKGLERVMGIFINTIPIRLKIEENETVNDYLNRVKESVIKDFENQELPYDHLIDALEAYSKNSSNQLIDSMFTLQSIDFKSFNLNGAEFSPCKYNNKTLKFNLLMESEDIDGVLSFRLEYNSMIFNKKDIAKLRDSYIEILRNICNEEKATLTVSYVYF